MLDNGNRSHVLVLVHGSVLTAVAKGTANITAKINGDDSTAVTQELTVLGAPTGWEGQFAIYGGDGIGGILEPSGTGNIWDGNEMYAWGNGVANYRLYRFSDAGDGYVYWHFDYNPNIVVASSGTADVRQKTPDESSDAQKWKLTPVDGKTGVYTIQNKATGTYVATSGDTGNAKIILSADATLKSVQWKVTALRPVLNVSLGLGNDTIAPIGVTRVEFKALADITIPAGGKLQIVLTPVNSGSNTDVTVSYIYLIRGDIPSNFSLDGHSTEGALLKLVEHVLRLQLLNGGPLSGRSICPMAASRPFSW